MIVSVKPKTPRKLLAVATPIGLYLESVGGGVTYLGTGSVASVSVHRTLDHALRPSESNKPVYKGDTVTLTF